LILLLLSGELPKYNARVLGENEPLHGASFPGTYKVLLPASLLREAVPVLNTSLAGHSHLWALPSGNRVRRCGVSKTNQASAAGPIFAQNKHYENSLVNPTYAGVVLYTWTLQCTTGHVRLFSIVSLSITSLHGLMLVRDSKSRCTSDTTLTVTCYTLIPAYVHLNMYMDFTMKYVQ